MTYLCIHLPAYRQLARLRKEALTKALEAINDFARESGSILGAQEEGGWLFRMPSAGTRGETLRRKRVFAFAVYALSGKLKEHERQLQGYNLLIDAVEEAKPAAVLELLKTRMRSLGSDGELMIAGDAILDFEGIFAVVPLEDDIYKITATESGNESNLHPAADLLVRERVLHDFTDTCESLHIGGNDVRTVILVAEPGDGGLSTVKYALHNIFSGTDASWITTHGSESRFGGGAPVTRGVVESLELFPLAEYLTGLERQVWESHIPILFTDSTEWARRPVNDRPEIDYYQIITLQLAAYRRWMEDHLLPAVWLCERYDLLAPSVKSACVRAAKSKARSFEIISVFVVYGQPVPEELLAVPHVLLRVPSLDTPEISSKVAGSEFEKAGDLVKLFAESSDRLIVSLYRVLMLSKNSEISAVTIKDPLSALLSAFDADLQTAVLHLIEGSLVLPEDPLAVYLEQIGLSRDTVRLAKRVVEELRLDIGGDAAEALIAAGCLRAKLGIYRKESARNLASFIASHFDHGGIPLSPAVVETVQTGGNPATAIDLIMRYVNSMLEAGNIRGASELLNRGSLSGADSDATLILSTLKLKTAILGNDSQRASACYSDLRAVEASGNQDIEGQRFIEFARYHFATGSFKEGLQNAKDALMALQQNDSERETEAYLFIGLHMLATSRLGEAEAYLQIACESVSDISPMLFIINAMYSAITQFMIGNMTRALAIVSEAKTRSDECALHRYAICLLFLEVRIQFELGRYSRCVDLCLKGLTLCQLYGDEPRAVFEKWLWRAQAFSGSPDEAAVALGRITADPEASLFLAEAYYLTNRWEMAFLSIENPEFPAGTTAPVRFLPAELVFWDTGFSNAEDRAITGLVERPVLKMLIRAFRAFLRCGHDDSETGLNDLARITREEKLSGIDPYNGIYFYFYAHAIGTTFDRNNIDRLTALSKAFKSIQERAAMMNDSSDKLSFLHHNYFNNLILAEAHEINLI